MTIQNGTTNRYSVNSFERMKVGSGQWETLPSFTTARFGHFSWADRRNNKIFIACGATDPKSPIPIDNIEVFDVSSSSWSQYPSKLNLSSEISSQNPKLTFTRSIQDSTVWHVSDCEPSRPRACAHYRRSIRNQFSVELK